MRTSQDEERLMCFTKDPSLKCGQTDQSQVIFPPLYLHNTKKKFMVYRPITSKDIRISKCDDRICDPLRPQVSHAASFHHAGLKLDWDLENLVEIILKPLLQLHHNSRVHNTSILTSSLYLYLSNWNILYSISASFNNILLWSRHPLYVTLKNKLSVFSRLLS